MIYNIQPTDMRFCFCFCFFIYLDSKFLRRLTTRKISSLLSQFSRCGGSMDPTGCYFLCSSEDRIQQAAILDQVPNLAFEDKFLFSAAPVNVDSEESVVRVGVPLSSVYVVFYLLWSTIIVCNSCFVLAVLVPQVCQQLCIRWLCAVP